MTPKQKVAFIDSAVNIEYLNEIIKDGQIIGGVFTVEDNNKIVPSGTLLRDSLTHATLCAQKFLDGLSSNCDLYFIEILDDKTSRGNINSLLTALSWCTLNEINLINLSIGTTLFADVPELTAKINDLVSKGTLIVAASSNNNKMTFPASFDNVIGVTALRGKFESSGFIYYENGIDRVEINCYVDSLEVEYNGKTYGIDCSNSLAAPVISAKICDCLNEGCDTLSKVKVVLKEQSMTVNHNQRKKMYQKYFKKKIDIPVIAILENANEDCDIAILVHKLLSRFTEHGYIGICLSQNFKTDLSQGVLNLLDYEYYSVSEKRCFYSHYCNIGFIVLHGDEGFIWKNFKVKDMDIIVTASELHNYKPKKRTKHIYLSKYKDFNVIIDEIYRCLS